MSGGTSRASLPFGPFTATVPPSTLTVTPVGTGMGVLPNRDMVLPFLSAYHT